MIVGTQEILANKGLNMDTHESLLPENSLVYMLNGDISGYENAGNGTFVQNVMSNEECFRYPEGYELLGAVPIGKSQFTLFFKTQGSSEIGIFDSNTCAYLKKINDPCLNLEDKITGVYRNRAGCDLRRVYWVEAGKPVRFIDVDECLPTKNIADCRACTEELVFDCEAFNMNRCVKFPEIKLREGTGNLPNGSYQVALALTDEKQRFTEYYVYPEVLKFHTNNQANNRFGVEIEFLTCPVGFEQYELVLIAHRTDRATLVQRIGYFGVEQTTNYISELDDPVYTPIDLVVLGQTFPHYQSANGIAANNEQLILSGVTYRDVPNYQPRANNIRSNWIVKKVRGKDAHKHMSFMRGEQYGFFIRGVYCDNERTPWYHLPSDAERAIKEYDADHTTNLWGLYSGPAPITDDVCDRDDPCNTDAKKYWELYDTSTVTCGTGTTTGVGLVPADPCGTFLYEPNIGNYPIQWRDCCGVIRTAVGTTTFCARDILQVLHMDPDGRLTYQGPCEVLCEVEPGEIPCDQSGSECDEVIVQKGNFGYWESTLKYPNNPCVWGQRTAPEEPYYDPFGLACQQLRYHKFPDNCTTHIHDNLGCDGEEFVNILGVQFSNIQPFLDKNGQPIKDITGYEIGVADRSNQKTILHKGLMYNMFEEEIADCTTSYYANYPFNDLRADVFLSKTPAIYDGEGQFGELFYTPVTKYSRDRFQYISPDVSFERNDSGTHLQIYAEENGFVEGQYSPTEEMPWVVIVSDLALLLITGLSVALGITLQQSFYSVVDGATTLLQSVRNGLAPVNYAINYFAKSVYNGYNCNRVVTGNIRRKIVNSQYLLPTKMLVDNDKVNNTQRESGLYLRLCADIQDPYLSEYSRIRLSDNGCSSSFGYCDTVNGIVPRTSSYYAGVKVERPAQYNMPESNLVRTVSKVFSWDNNSTVFTPPVYGGDTHITKHKYIRKFPFFQTLPLNLPTNTQFKTSPYFNVWNTRYWLDVKEQTTFLGLTNLGANDDRNLERVGGLRKKFCGQDDGDCTENLAFRVDGKFYTHVVGEAHYWCESDYIGDFRELNEIPESDVERTPAQKIQYRTVQYPELFLYNRQYHWKGWSAFGPVFDSNYNCCKPDDICSLNTIAYSVKHDPLSKGDAWTKFLPNSVQQFSNRDGNLVGIKEIDDFNLLIAFEDATYITQQDETLSTNNGTQLYIGSPDAFSRRLRKISDDATGFGGCIDLDSIVNSRYGTFWFDRKRKKFIHFSNQVSDITGNIQSWLNENLEGPITGVYDNFTDNLYYTGQGKDGCMWTLSFKPKLKDWVSFHSFTPDRYLAMSNNYLSSNGEGLWKHNKHYEYQRYYGIPFAFDVGFIMKNKMSDLQLQTIEVYSEWVKFQDFGTKVYDQKSFFDKILVFNQLRSTGVREIFVKDKNNAQHVAFQNASDLVECTPVEDFTYRINKFQVDQTKGPFNTFKCMDYGPSDYVQQETSGTGLKAHMRGKWFRTHLINTKRTDYKILLQLNIAANEEIVQ